MKFSEIHGHHQLKANLRASIRQGRIPHAQMMIAKEGCSALPMAIAYAQYVACLNKTEDDSCGVCSSCVKYNQMIHPDLHFSFPIYGSNETCDDFMQEFREAVGKNPLITLNKWFEAIDGDNKKPNINIKECRNIIRKLSLKPYESDYKVLIMWLPEYLGKEGNVLLKLLEEPPEKTLFLLVTENQEMILTTIISRTQYIKIPVYSSPEIEHYLSSNGLAEGDLAKNAALMAEGNLSKAVDLAKEMDNPQFEVFRLWLLDCYQGNIGKIIAELDTFVERGKEQVKMLLIYGIHMVRASMLINHQDLSSRLSSNELEFAGKLSKLIGLEAANTIYHEFNRAIFEIDRNGSVKIILINLSLNLKNCLKSENKKTVEKTIN